MQWRIKRPGCKRAVIVDGVEALIFLDECNINSGSVALYMARIRF